MDGWMTSGVQVEKVVGMFEAYRVNGMVGRGPKAGLCLLARGMLVRRFVHRVAGVGPPI